MKLKTLDINKMDLDDLKKCIHLILTTNQDNHDRINLLQERVLKLELQLQKDCK